jgi:hypothetical protein
MAAFDAEGTWPELPNQLLFLNGSRVGSTFRLDRGRVLLDINRVRKAIPFLPFGLPVRAPFEGGVYFGIQRSAKAPSAYDVWTAMLAPGHITLNGDPKPDILRPGFGESDGHVIRPVPGDILTVELFSESGETPLRLEFLHSDHDDERPLGPWLVPIDPRN